MIVLIAAIVALVMVCLLLVGYIAALLVEANRMARTIATITETDTNSQVFTLTRNPYFRKLATRINGLLTAQRSREQKIKKADLAFKESVTGISHDLRTPLTSVSGYLQMLADDKTPPERKAEYLIIIQRRLDALLMLLDELFEYTRIEADRPALQPEKVNLGSTLLEQLALYYEEFSNRGIAPVIDVPQEPELVFCDRKNLERIFQNLIKNALVHSGGGLWVTMKREGANVIVDFANPADAGSLDSERLFDRFYTGDKSRSGKSTGLGLAIVRQLAQQIDAQVGAKYENGMLHIFVECNVVT